MRRSLVLGAALAVWPLSVLAGPRDDVIGVLVKCTDVTDERARLACYDQEAPALRAAAEVPAPPVATAEPQSVAAPAAPEAPPPPQQGGWSLSGLDPFGGDTSPPSSAQMAYQPIGQEILPITIAVRDYTVEPSGSFTVTLANGQVWRERNEHYETPRFDPAGGNVVTIEHGLIGGYNLYLTGSGKPYKVVRVK